MRMILTVLAALMMAAAPTLAAEGLKPDKGEPRPKANPYAEVEDAPGLPRVLLLGDSISIGYTLSVRAQLKGVANVHRPGTNCNSTAYALEDNRLDHWLGEKKWDVIHFNFGLHDLKYIDAHMKAVPPAKGKQWVPVEQYKKNLHAVVARLKKTGAKLIFATTTPVPEGNGLRIPGDDVKYNAAALEVMKEEGVVVDDLYAAVLPKLSEYQMPKNVHYNNKGYRFLAEQVVASVRQALGATEASRK